MEPSDDWMVRNAERLMSEGKDFDTMMLDMAKRMDEIAPGRFFDIAGVKPENREMFVRVAMMYVQTERHYRLSEDATKLYNLTGTDDYYRQLLDALPVVKIPTDATKEELQRLEAEERRIRRERDYLLEKIKPR